MPHAKKLALTATGLIWTRYSMVIIPKNWTLFTVNLFVAGTGLMQVGRIMMQVSLKILRWYISQRTNIYAPHPGTVRQKNTSRRLLLAKCKNRLAIYKSHPLCLLRSNIHSNKQLHTISQTEPLDFSNFINFEVDQRRKIRQLLYMELCIGIIYR